MGRKKAYNVGDLIRVGDTDTFVKVSRYDSYTSVGVIFPSGYEADTQVGHILKGQILDVYKASVCGVGYIGEGNFKVSNNRNVTKHYRQWRDMLRRCYDPSVHEIYPSYIGCSVVEEWHNFQNFAEWFESYELKEESWNVDKDLLIPRNKIYSPGTCCIIPQEINGFLLLNRSRSGELPTGVSYRKDRGFYKALVMANGKSKYLGSFSTSQLALLAYVDGKKEAGRLLAEKWKGRVHTDVHNCLMNFNVRDYL